MSAWMRSGQERINKKTPSPIRLLSSYPYRINGHFGLENLLPPGLAALVHQLFQILAPCAGGYEKGIGCIDNDEVVHSQAGDNTIR